MSTYAKIRALIPDAASAKTADEIDALLPDVKRQAIRAGLCDMLDCEVIARTGDAVNGYRYHVIRPVKLRAYATPEESKEAKRARDRAYAKARGRRVGLRKEGTRSLEEWRAQRAASKAARLKRLADERAARRQQRIRDRAAIVRVAAPKRVGRTQAQRLLANEPHESVRLREAPPVKVVRVESVSEWMARTGQRPQVLPVAWNEARAM
ncbi:MAG TPA: hypothetical protein VLC71_06115 [Thermomonas sp.]|nr:hypothetical protein [Thermomonas sp.]